MADYKSKTCCLFGQGNIDAGQKQAMLARLRYILWRVFEQGYCYFGVGGAVGFDMLAAEYLIKLRDDPPGKNWLRIISVLPYPDYMKDWTEDQKKRQETIIKKSDKVVYMAQEYEPDIMLKQQRHLIEASSQCICFCNQSTGDMASAVRYAIKHGLKVHNTSSWDIRQLK